MFNLLLQVMDHGTLTDNNGRKADFRNVILVMTTNAGAADMARPSIGFASQDHRSDGMEALKRLFTPEFRNRLDAVIQFEALKPEVVRHVVDKFLVQVEVQLESKNVHIEFYDSARAWLARHGYDEAMGARPMARLIQDQIKRPLAEELLFGKLSKGGQIRVSANEDGLQLDIEDAAALA